MTHAWCHDIDRDAAVRAAEDNRTRPLPTLGEAIAAPFACAACGGFGMDHRCKESCEECDGEGRAMFPKSGSATSGVEQENKGDGMRQKWKALNLGETVVAGDEYCDPYGNWKVVQEWMIGQVLTINHSEFRRRVPPSAPEAIARPFADAAERSVPVSESGEGQSGMRTERVVLEFEIERGSPPSEWPWSYILSRSDALEMRPAESVRVVDGDITDNEIALTVERDAAIRERDELKARLSRVLKSSDSMWSRILAVASERDNLKARVAELEAAAKLAPDANDDGGSNHAAQAASGNSSAILTSSQAASGGGEGEPVAWGVIEYREGPIIHATPDEEEANQYAGTVVPLYRQPPQARGWLTEEERFAIEDAIGPLRESGKYACENRACLLEDLLALVNEDIRKALAAAGVAVKEVP
jgi:hypothetical protein